MGVIKSVKKGIMDKVKAGGDFNTSISGRMFYYQAPEDTISPYATFSFVANNPDYTFTEDMEDFLIQINIFDNRQENNLDSSKIDDITTNLWAMFDEAVLTVSGYINIRLQRVSSRPSFKVDEYWQTNTDYRLQIEKS